MFEPLSRIPDGMRYYFGREARARRAVEDKIMSIFDGWSYEEIVGPSVDYYALFERGMGREEAHRAFRFMDFDALRPDVTSSVARAAATLFSDSPRPLRLCYAASVFKQRSRSHAEWRRESTHLGCEYIGEGQELADLEILAIAAEVFTRLGLEGRFRITLSSAEIFNGVQEQLGLSGELREEFRRLIDLKDTAELHNFVSQNVPQSLSSDFSQLAQLLRLSGKREILDQARKIFQNGRSSAALSQLERLWQVIETLGLSDSFDIDLGDVSGLDYYTGLFFKFYVTGAGSRIGRGGRYDGLTANFGRSEPAVGFVIDLESLTDVLVKTTTVKDEDKIMAPRLLKGNDISVLVDAVGRRKLNEKIELEY
jgi:ATP phosphoribosyltransferase regulatory subunit